MPDGGTIGIRAGKASGKVHPDLDPGDYVTLTVSDNGSGMTPEIAARAFEPFFSTKGVGKGTGLGLSMVFGVVSQAGGAVEIETEEGEGTTIRLFLRRVFSADGADVEVPGLIEAGSPLAGRTILVIDDDPEVLQTVAASLRAMGASVETAPDGEAGLQAGARDGIDLVVVDFAMPGLSGADVAARSRAAFADRPVLIVTGFSESAKLEAVSDQGVGLLRKPFDSEALLRAVTDLLVGR
jgi:CheY-like chemotaxis protein